MSEIIRVAFVVEGKTDYIMLSEVVKNLLGDLEFIPTILQPMESASNPIPGGWPGVYHWCHQTVEDSAGGISSNILFLNYDILLIQLDADVAGVSYTEGHIEDEVIQDLPCEKPCPPPSATTNALRNIMLRWIGEDQIPPKTVFCTPSKSLEAWVLVGLFPKDKFVDKIECKEKPENILSNKPHERRLIRSGSKDVDQYKRYSEEFGNTWDFICQKCTEAQRFHDDFIRLIPTAE